MGNGSEKDFVDNIKKIKDRKQIAVIAKLFSKYGTPGQAVPRNMENRGKELFKIIRSAG